MSKRLGLAIAVILQSLALVGMVGIKQWTLATGTPVLLETEPVDPRSLFRGDYVRLAYGIGTLNLAEIGGDDDFEVHDPVHVLLRPGDRYWEAVSLHRSRPEVPSRQVAIKGRVDYIGWNFIGEDSAPIETGITIRYGIENYFVPEGTGGDLERPPEGEEISIQVAVDRYGNAGIKAVLVNDEVRYEERLF